MANRHMKMFNITDIREMQIKTTMRVQLTSIKMVIIKGLQITNLKRMWRNGNPSAQFVGL